MTDFIETISNSNSIPINTIAEKSFPSGDFTMHLQWNIDYV